MYEIADKKNEGYKRKQCVKMQLQEMTVKAKGLKQKYVTKIKTK